MSRRYYDYRIMDITTGKTIKIPSDLGQECKRLGITSTEIINNYNEYNSLGMRVTFADGALKAIYMKKKSMVAKQ